MPDLDKIKQVEQGVRTGVDGSPGAGRAIPPAVDTLSEAIETSDFKRRLQLIEADRSNEPGTHRQVPHRAG